MICYYLQARFAAFRTFTGGSFRPVAGFVTHSAAYGLLLNIAGIEQRTDDGKSPMTLIKKDLPRVKIALGAFVVPNRHSLLQQLHNYPVGASGKEHAPFTKGNKYNIIPVRREILSDIRAYIQIDGNDELEAGIREGLAGKISRQYGLPFLGDNNFLIDRFEAVANPEPVHWYEKVDEEQEGIVENITRLTLTIDRADLSQTRSALFAPTKKRAEPPSGAWVEIGY